jgi:hypothetical protein
VKALFFSPFSNVWEHAYPVSLVANGLQERGVAIEVMNCEGLYQDFCIAMSAAGLTAESSLKKRVQVCNACNKRRKFLSKEFDFSNHVLEQFVSEGDSELVASLTGKITVENWFSFIFHEIPIGRYAAYEFLLHYKILGTSIPEKLFPFYLDQLRLSIMTLIAAERALSLIQPDVVLTYNRLYGVNHAFLAVAEQRKIPTYSLQGGAHITHHGESITLFKDSQSLFQVLDSPSWKEASEETINLAEAELVTSHLVGLLGASSAFAYSSGFDSLEPSVLREKLSIRPNTPVMLIPMSSEDELNAAELADFLPDRSSRPNLFKDQFSWIRHIFDFASKNPDLSFVLRLHPRMYPNKREGILAPVVEKVIELIQEAPDNVCINYPTDEISLYDLLQIVDVVLGYRSTVGLEASAFGIPVVAPANKDFFTYPDEISRTAYTKQEFDQNIHLALAEGWNIENTRRAYRWLSYLFTRVAADLSGSISSKPISVRPKKPGLRLWLWRKMVFLMIQFGPMVRERLSLRKKNLPLQANEKIFEVISEVKNNLTEVRNLSSRNANKPEETAALVEQLEFFLKNYWSNIHEEDSLAQRVRYFLERR